MTSSRSASTLCLQIMQDSVIFWLVSEKMQWSISLFLFKAINKIMQLVSPTQSLFLICHQYQWFSSFLGPASQVAVDFKGMLASIQSYSPKLIKCFSPGFWWKVDCVCGFINESPKFQRTTSYSMIYILKICFCCSVSETEVHWKNNV